MAWVRRSFSSRAENARQSSRLFSTGRAADSQRNIAGSVTTCLVSQSGCRCIEPAGGAPILRILFAAVTAAMKRPIFFGREPPGPETERLPIRGNRTLR
jgi:hypothetical protein